jgi:hypothetical protein
MVTQIERHESIIMNSKLERLNGLVEAYFKTLFQHMVSGTKKICHEKCVMTDIILVEVETRSITASAKLLRKHQNIYL